MVSATLARVRRGARLLIGGLGVGSSVVQALESGAGRIDVVEVEELVDSGLTVLDGTTAELLAWEDVENLASSISPGRSAAVIVWEYLSTASFTRAARASGAQLVARGRIPGRAIVSALASE